MFYLTNNFYLENSVPRKNEVLETRMKKPDNLSSFESEFEKLEWKLEITLSTIKMKKVSFSLLFY